MKRKIRIAQYGCGKMAIPTMKYVYDHGAEIICAFSKTDRAVGKDIGELMHTEKKGVIIQYSTEVEKIFSETKPDICIVETLSYLPDCEDIFMLCARMGINVISTNEEAFYPWNSRYKMTRQIDELAKKTGCTICGSGLQDVTWAHILATVAGSSNKITKIKGCVLNSVEDYGLAFAQVNGVNLTMAEFENRYGSINKLSEKEAKGLIEIEEFEPSYMWNTNGWICSKFGLTIESQIQRCVPQTHTENLWCDTLGTTIQAGNATGMSSSVVTTTTKEGIEVETELIAKVYAPEEEDFTEWIIYGDPDIYFTFKKPASVEMTCATIVNRIPDVINAEPGFVTTDKMPSDFFRIKPLNEYVK